MDKKQYFNMIRDNYFNNFSCNFQAFKDMIKGVMPVFGELKVDVTKNDNGNIYMVFKDIDRADIVITSEDIVFNEEDLDMSRIFLKLTLDEENNISIVEHHMSIFTPANKDTVLFLGSIIGKKILF